MDTLDFEVIKILVLGDVRVGKTSFIRRFVDNDYSENYKCTIGCDFVCKTVKRPGSRRACLKLQFWDIAGQERFPLLTKAYYRYARGCVIMFDITKRETFTNVRRWKQALDNNVEESEIVPCLLVANKVDLLEPVVSYSEINKLCKECGFSEWTMTSVKNGTMVKETISYLLDVVIRRSSPIYNPTEYNLLHYDIVDLQDEERKRKKMNRKRIAAGQYSDSLRCCDGLN